MNILKFSLVLFAIVLVLNSTHVLGLEVTGPVVDEAEVGPDSGVGSKDVEVGVDPGVGSNDVEVGPALSSRWDGDWVLEDQSTFSAQIASDDELIVSFNRTSGKLESSDVVDVYYSLNVTAQRAIDRCPQWLNTSLSFKFSDLTPQWQVKYGEMLLGVQNESYLDEIGFSIVQLSQVILTHSDVDLALFEENVDSMYKISRELKYAEIIEVEDEDGKYSTVRYAMPGGKFYTLPKDIYYKYLATPRANSEVPAYVNETLVETTDSANQYIVDHTMGDFWRPFLYNKTSDPGYPILADLLDNETVLWKEKRSNIDDNGAIGAVCTWQRDCVPTWDIQGNRNSHPMVVYKHHWGFCGENSNLLAAACKVALIPCIPTLDLNVWHGWNDFYERGWHQLQAYSGHVDEPGSQVQPGYIEAVPGESPDGSQLDQTPVYTPTANLTVTVVDPNGNAVDGAMVKLSGDETYNNPYNIGVIGNGTDAWGKAAFDIGMSRDIYVHVESPYGQYPSTSSSLVEAVLDVQAGEDYSIELTVPNQLTTDDLDPIFKDDEKFDTGYTISLDSVEQWVRMNKVPFGSGEKPWRNFPGTERAMVMFLDDDNLEKYQTDQAFRAARVLNISGSEVVSTTLPGDIEYHLILTGRYMPRTRGEYELNVTYERFDGTPVSKILTPLEGIFLVGEQIGFKGVCEPVISIFGTYQYRWESNVSGVLSSEAEFTGQLDVGWHNITFTTHNGTDDISVDWVNIIVEYPNRPPVAVISSPLEGQTFKNGTMITFGTEGTYDPDGDNLTYTWDSPLHKYTMNNNRSIVTDLPEGNYNIRLWVSDEEGLQTLAQVNITVLPPNRAPRVNISSPAYGAEFMNGTKITFDSLGTFDDDTDLEYTWISNISGVFSKKPKDWIVLEPGEHLITLWVNDTEYNQSTYILINIKQIIIVVDLPPVPVISSPREGEKFNLTEVVHFSSLGSFDPEGNSMKIRWFLDGYPVSVDYKFSKELEAGDHTVRLEISDGTHWSKAYVNFTVIDRPPVIEVKLGDQILTNNQKITVNEQKPLVNATGSYDPDGDTLEFVMYLNGEASYYFALAQLDLKEGKNYLKIEVTDSGGNLAEFYLEIEYVPEEEVVPPEDNSTEPTVNETSENNEKDMRVFYSMLLLLVITAIGGLAVFVFIQLKSSNSKEEFLEELDEELEELDDIDEPEEPKVSWEEEDEPGKGSKKEGKAKRTSKKEGKAKRTSKKEGKTKRTSKKEGKAKRTSKKEGKKKK